MCVASSVALASFLACAGTKSANGSANTNANTNANAGEDLGAGDIDDPSTRPGGPGTTGQTFDPAKAAQLRAERDQRWHTLETTLRKADAKTLWDRGQEQEKSQNWKEAEDAYEALVVFFPKDANAPKAIENAMRMAFRRAEYGEGFQFFEDALVAYDNDALTKARLLRVLAASELAVPHWGTTRGGDYLRGRYEQGKQTQTYAEDRAKAIGLLENARDLLAKTQSAPAKERASVDVELALAVARFTQFDSTWGWWWTPENGPDDGLADAEGDDENADRYVDRSWSAALSRAKPHGLPVTPQGDVVFTSKPKAYAPTLNETAKIKFLLDEAQSIDDDPHKEIAAQALLQQALLFRTRDGGERLDRLRNWWWAGSYPYRDAAKDDELYKLGDDEVITLVATGVRKVTVPADESVPRLFAEVQKKYPQSKAADEAQSLLGLFYQSREQYPKAVDAYETYVKAHPQGEHLGEVRASLDVIRAPEVVFQAKGGQAAGKPAQVSLRFRNTDKVHFVAHKIDVDHLIADFKKAWTPGPHRRDRDDHTIDPENLGWAFVNDNAYYDSKRYLAHDATTFDAAVKPDATMRYADSDVTTPLEKAGVYLVEAFVDAKGKRAENATSRTLVVIDQGALVVKQTATGAIAWVVDARSGKPYASTAVDVFLYGSKWERDQEIRMSKSVTAKTDAHGVAALPKNNELTALVSTKIGGATVIPVQQWLGNDYRERESQENETVAVVVTDRPVYRPGDTVQMQVWARHKKDGAYQPALDVKNLEVRVTDSRGQELVNETKPANAFGSRALQIALKKGASLGTYRVEVTADGNYADDAGATFAVEEYKAPEVNVTVTSPSQAKLGEKISVDVHADYYSGGPVNAAKVRYKVFRQDHQVEYAAPTPWDWLYGVGFGRIWYRYPWFSWWKDYGPRPIIWYAWWGPKPEEPKELVQEGEGATDAKGVLHVVVDTAKAKAEHGDRDHRYSIEAEVTDLSRHVVKGTGSVDVTRTAFVASLELEAGWARPGDDVSLVIATVSPDGSLRATQGKLRVDEILGVTENGAVRGEQLVDEKPLATDANGPTRTRWKAPKTGQYRFTYTTKDKEGNDVKASAVAWVVGPAFVGEKYRFAGVEIIPDKRVYQPGDVARLLVSADRKDASVLLATKVDNGFLVDWKVIELPNKTTIVELPITKEHTPNFFVEATTVADAQVFDDAREMFVPPQGAELNVKIAASKSELEPGQKDDVTVTTTDGQGKPISAEVAVSVFDSAVLAIAPDSTVDARAHLWGRKRTHSPTGVASLGRTQAVWGALVSPEQQARWQLQSRSQMRFQRQIDFVNEADTGGLAGGDALATGAMGHAAMKTLSRSANAMMAAEGEGRASGAKDKAKVDDAEAALDEKKPMMQATAAPAKESERREGPATTTPTSGEGQGAPHVRTRFADTALFAVVVTDANGVAKVNVPFPENTTTWKVRALGIDANARAGRGDASIVTTKKLLVRMATPRFFRERDELTLSAIVQNKHEKAEHVTVSLDVTDDLLDVKGGKSSKVEVPANGEVRVDFDVKVRGEGEAKVRVTAKGDDDGDAKELSFPVLVHGMQKTVAAVGSIAAGSGNAEKSITIEVPKERREDQTDLVIRTSPSLAGGMIDALPYLLDYPYGCVEQTLSRFVPAVLTRRALQQSGGIKLEDLAKAHRDLNAQHLGTDAHGNVDPKRAERENKEYDRNPIYNTQLLGDIIDEGLQRITKMQHSDGGWGWWADDSSSVYMTSLVLSSLLDAKDADLPIDQNMIERGRAALRAEVESDIWRYKEKNNEKYVSDGDAYALWVMSRFNDRHDELLKLLYERRLQLSPYGKLLLALAEKNLGQESQAKLLLENVEQFRKADTENETSWIETATAGWWYWWNDDIETNALYLRALDAIRPKDAIAPQIVKWLLNHRKNGWYWNSTRDTAMVVGVFANHMQVSGERRPDYDLTIAVDGKPMKTVHVDAKNMFTVDTDLRMHGKELGGGKHTVTIAKRGEGAVYFNSYLSYFTLEDDIKASGLEVKVDRRYYKLVRHDRQHTVADTNGNDVNATEVAYQKVPLSSGDEVKSGDLILVELNVTSKNDYTYLAFEDPKPAGCEAVAIRSGTVFGETWAHMELRDDRVVFFLEELTQGSIKLSYRLRAELPGSFSAMPTNGFAMYAPEIKANSDEMKLRIHD